MGTNVVNAKPTTVRQSTQHAGSFNMELNSKFETKYFLVAFPRSEIDNAWLSGLHDKSK